MDKSSKVSIILPVYNGEQYIASAIKSVLDQSYSNFTLIVIDDGSTDRTLSIIKSFSDKRILLVQNPTNLGLIYSLNKGIEIADSKYIARMDADDIMHEERILHQYHYMERHPEVDICGTFITMFNDSERIGLLTHGCSNSSIRAELLFNSPIFHPTYFCKSETIKKYRYNEGYKYCEDYELLARLLKKHIAHNLPLNLLYYRITDKSMTRIGEKNKEERFEKISAIHRWILTNYLNFDVHELDNTIHYDICLSHNINSQNSAWLKNNLCRLKKYFNLIEIKNKHYCYCKPMDLKLYMGKIWAKLIRHHIKGRFGHDLVKLIVSPYTLYGCLSIISYFFHILISRTK